MQLARHDEAALLDGPTTPLKASTNSAAQPELCRHQVPSCRGHLLPVQQVSTLCYMQQGVPLHWLKLCTGLGLARRRALA